MSDVPQPGAAPGALPGALPGVVPGAAPEAASGAVLGQDGLRRCGWGESTDDYRVYHDTEWGRPVHGDDALFERVSLEAFQSGLSWITILRRREGFRAAFAGFEIAKVAELGAADAERLMLDPGIIRNRAKIEATIANAKAALELDGGLEKLIWGFAGDPDRPAPRTLTEVPAVTSESTALAKALKKQGFRFVGPTTAYALMQACGLVDDHLADCHVRPSIEIQRLTAAAQRPRTTGR